MNYVNYYHSAYGRYVIPDDVLARSYRLADRFGRGEYLKEWCKWQWMNHR